MDAIGCINISCFKQNASIWWIIRKTLQQIVPRIWTTKKVQPRMENDGQPGILIHTNNGFHTELGSPFPGWKIISTHYQGFRNNVQINVQATSKHVVWGLISLILLVFFNQPLLSQSSPLQNTAKTEPCTGSGKALVDWKCLRCLRHVWRGKEKPSVGFGWFRNWDTFLGYSPEN